MADKKVELHEENLDEVAGGKKVSGKDVIDIAAGIVAGGVAAYQGYHQTKKILDAADGTTKSGGNSGSGINNSIGGKNNKSFQQGGSNQVGNNSKVSL